MDNRIDIDAEEDFIVASIVADLMEMDDDTESSSSDSSNSSDEDLLERRCDLKLGSDFAKHLAKYDEQEFISHFRLSKTTVNYIISVMEQDIVFPNYKPGRENITTEKGVYMTLWYLGNRETFRQVSNRYNVTLSASHRCITLVIKYLVQKRNKFVKWPTDAEIHKIYTAFFAINQIPNCIGAIDGSHIPILKPRDNQEAYCNRKSFHSIILQAVCDNTKKFTDLYCGEPGSLHDARVLKKSKLYSYVTSGMIEMEENYILGDSAYPNMKWLVTPYKDNGCLTQNQKKFNTKISSARIVIENAFGLLKSRFRRLKGFDNLKIEFIVEAVIAACVLHNICITMNDLSLVIQEVEEEIEPTASNSTDVNSTEKNSQTREQLFHNMFS